MGIALILPECDFGDKSLGKVTIKGNVPLTGISIVGDDNVNGVEAQYTCMYSPAVTAERDVVYSVESGNQYAYINPTTGKLLVLEGASNANVTIKAVSALHPDIYATKNIVVTYNATESLVLREGLALVSDGTAYLNAAEYFAGAKRWNTIALNMEIVFKIYETGSDNLHIFGVSKATVSGAGYLDAVYLGGQSKLRFGGIGMPDIYSDTSNVANSLYKFSSYMAGNISIEKDGNVVFTQPTVGCGTMTQDLFPLFARITNGGSGWATYPGAANVGIYSFKLATQADGDVCDLVPCIYNGVKSMYDKVSEQVLTAVNGGVFTLNQ
jgi:hypothetical protein